MGYYIRFLQTDQTDTTLPLLETALKRIDSAYSIAIDPAGWCGRLWYGSEVCGEIEINTPDQKLFGEEIAELNDALNRVRLLFRIGWKIRRAQRNRVRTVLNESRIIVCVRILYQGRGAEATLVRLDPLWSWLLQNRVGLVMFDAEGYYDLTGQIAPH
jgi:hypothetical protein